MEQAVGENVLDTYLAPAAPRVACARRRDPRPWTELLGVVSWDEAESFLGAALGEESASAELAPVIERCRNKRDEGAPAQDRRVRVNRARWCATRRGARLPAAGRSWPIVVKPTGGAGSEHVFFAATTPTCCAVARGDAERGEGEVLLEEFVGGIEFASTARSTAPATSSSPTCGSTTATEPRVDNLYFETSVGASARASCSSPTTRRASSRQMRLRARPSTSR